MRADREILRGRCRRRTWRSSGASTTRGREASSQDQQNSCTRTSSTSILRAPWSREPGKAERRSGRRLRRSLRAGKPGRWSRRRSERCGRPSGGGGAIPRTRSSGAASRWRGGVCPVDSARRGGCPLCVVYEAADALQAAGLRSKAMSQENVEILRHGFEEWNRRGLDGIVDLLDEESNSSRSSLTIRSAHFRARARGSGIEVRCSTSPRSQFGRARPRGGSSTPNAAKPSKPPGSRSRRCWVRRPERWSVKPKPSCQHCGATLPRSWYALSALRQAFVDLAPGWVGSPSLIALSEHRAGSMEAGYGPWVRRGHGSDPD